MYLVDTRYSSGFVDLLHQALEHFTGTYFGEGGGAVCDHLLYGLCPSYSTGQLVNEVLEKLLTLAIADPGQLKCVCCCSRRGG